MLLSPRLGPLWWRGIKLLFWVSVVWIVATETGLVGEVGSLGLKDPPNVTQLAKRDIPTKYRKLYAKAGRDYRIPWTVLAGIGKVESDHGRSSAPGVRSGVNRFGCCAGPMQFNLRNGPPSTWDRYGKGSPYRPEHAIPAAARLLRANGARYDLDRALYSYNHSWSYVATVKAWARKYATGRLSA